MIGLTRVRTAAAVPTGFRGPKRIERLNQLIAGFQAGENKFTSDVWKAAKNQLKKETFGKCAYCEAPTSAVAHGDVEHFRPKSVYWWLAYCYENYTYSCQICNQTYKGDKFPISGPAMQPGDLTGVAMLTPDPLDEAQGMPYADFRAACLAETPHLPDVYSEDPERLFKWIADRVKKEVTLEPREAGPEFARAAEAAVKILGLNRAELRGLRWSVYEQLELFRDFVLSSSPNDPLVARAQDMIRTMMHGRAEFAGMARYFVRDEWQMGL